MLRLCARLFCCFGCAAMATAQDDAYGPASFWQREIATHRALAGSATPRRLTRVALATRPLIEEPAAKPAESAPPVVTPAATPAATPAVTPAATPAATPAVTSEAPAAAIASPEKPAKAPLAERLNSLRGKIQGAEARLLYSTAPEERALAYNAERRAEMRTRLTQLEREGSEQHELLLELSSEYRALAAKADRERWLKEKKELVVHDISAFLDARRRGAAVDAGMKDLDSTDERLRRLIEKKRSHERGHGRDREANAIEENVRIDLPVPAPIAPEPELTPAELDLLQKLFPAR